MKEMFRRIIAVFAALLMVILLTVPNGGRKAYAEELPELSNVSIGEDGYMAWDPYPGAQDYWVTVDHYVSRPTGGVAFRYLNEDIDDYVIGGDIENSGMHTITVEAYADGEYIAKSELTYTYVSPYGPKGVIENVTISSEGIMTWDPYPNATKYDITIDGAATRGTTETTYNVNRDIDDYILYGYIENSGTHTVKLEAYMEGSVTMGEYETEYNYTATFKVAVPKAKNLTYNGEEQTGVEEGVHMSVSYNKATKAGQYTAQLHLDDQVNYTWEDGTTGDKFVKWRICFKDVPETHTFQKAVYWASEYNIVSGYSGSKEGYFGVGDNVTRGQVVAFLWRAAGKPNPSTTTQTFQDVPTTHSFYKAIQWASENGIVSGYSGSKAGYFGPGDKCTRAQIVTFLWRYAGKPAPAGNTQTFTDVPTTNQYYKAIQWASENSIAAGYNNGSFGVGDTCTRGQCVTFLYRMLK